MRLYVNIDHVATLREARRTDEPDPVRAAEAAERGGADGITCHLREDRRHIQDADVRALKASIRTVLNLELAQHPDIARLARRVRPFQATLVPERRREITTEGGLAVRRTDRRLRDTIRRLADAGLRVSLLIGPELKTIDAAAAHGGFDPTLPLPYFPTPMTQPDKPVAMSDFFALEAGEYLERLDALLQPSEPPSADELVRLARALRGSALMANHQAIARAAAG